MKRLWVLILIFSLVLIYGCFQKDNTNNVNSQVDSEISKLAKEEALEIVNKANDKYYIVTNGGYGLPNCEFENKKPVEINGNQYLYLGTSLDTVYEFNKYLGDVFTDKTIQAIKESLSIIVYRDKLLRLNADAGGGSMWAGAEIISLEQDGKTTEVEFKVPWEIDDTEFDIINITFRFIQNKGWLIDTDEPSILY